MITLEQLNQVLDDKLDKRFAEFGKKQTTDITAQVTKHMMVLLDPKFAAITDSIDNLTVETYDLKKRVGHLEVQMDRVQETLEDLGNAEYKDALASINLEKRISRLEKLQNIKPVPVKHLRKFAA